MAAATGRRETETDEELARRAREGDAAALRTLYDRYVPRLRERIRRSLRSDLRRKVSESDVIQEAFLVLNRRLADFEDRGEGSFGGWLLRIVDMKVQEVVRHYVGTRMRDVGQEITRGRRRPSGAFPAAAPTPSKAAMERERGECVQGAIDALSPDYREVIRLVHEEELSMEEAGERMNRSAEAARKLYSRAIARISEALEERDDR